MVCNACRRKVDPNRSFCPKCGSSVFVDENDVRTGHVEQPHRVNAPDRPSGGATTPMPQRPKRPSAAKPAQSPGCSGCLVRLVLLVAAVWYGGRWLMTIPEVKAAASALLAGSVSDGQIAAALSAVRAQILGLLGAAQ